METMDDELDNHLCLRCQRQFRSLESYVEHRKEFCTPTNQSSNPTFACTMESDYVENSNLDCLTIGNSQIESPLKLKETFLAKLNDTGTIESGKRRTTRSVKPAQRWGQSPTRSSGDKLVPELWCSLCTSAFTCENDLVEHLNTIDHWKNRNKNNDAHVALILSKSHILATYSSFKCNVCSFYFNHHEDLVNHWNSKVEAHSNCKKRNVKFNCSACTLTLKTPEEVIAHLLGNSEHLENVKQTRDGGRSVIISTTNVQCCTNCNWKGRTKSDLKLHIKNKHLSVKNPAEKNWPEDKSFYKCLTCTFSSREEALLNEHVSKFHNTEDNIGTKISEILLSDESSAKPKRNYTKSYACQHCKLTFTNAHLLSEHIRDLHPERLFHCEICSVDFETESLYVKHVHSRMHKQFAAGMSDTGETSGEEHKCDQCEFKSISKSAWLFHLAIHEGPVKCDDDNEVDKKRGNMYRCPVCGQNSKLSDLRSHLVLHTAEKPFICQYCEESFTSKGTLTSHIRSKHVEKKFACAECSFRTHRRDKLAAHEEIHHKDQRVRSFLCDTCGTGFYNRSTLKHHMRLHLPVELGGKTQICSFPGCRLSFRSPSELVIHMRTHTGERPFLCGTCGYSAKTKHQLTKHERSHFDQRPFKCSHCSYSTSLSYHLLRHMRIHTGAKPFSCPYCDYTCNTHENLRKHVLKSKKHVGLSVYKCPNCDFGCNWANELKTHMFSSHSDVIEQADHSDSAFSSLITGIFNRQNDVKTVENPSTTYVPRTEKPGYREKMKQLVRPKINMETGEIVVLNTYEIEEMAEENVTEIVDENLIDASEEVAYLAVEVEYGPNY